MEAYISMYSRVPAVASINELTLTDDQEATKDKADGSCLRNRWHTCPELHKAMDGVTYIADHTKKEEESTRVS